MAEVLFYTLEAAVGFVIGWAIGSFIGRGL
jgi:hypothetical protein